MDEMIERIEKLEKEVAELREATQPQDSKNIDIDEIGKKLNESLSRAARDIL